MPRIPVHTVDDAPAAAQEGLQGLKEQFGKVLNIHGEMAHSPALLASYLGIQSALAEHGSFDARTREAIALVVGATNDCGYCQAAHTGGARAAGWDEGQTKQLRAGSPVDPDGGLDALLAVARQMVSSTGYVEEDVWQAALDAGWSTEELGELVPHVMVNMFTNYFNHYARTELDLPAAPALHG